MLQRPFEERYDRFPMSFSSGGVIGWVVAQHPSVSGLIRLDLAVNAGTGEGFLQPLLHVVREPRVLDHPRNLDTCPHHRCQKMLTLRRVSCKQATVVGDSCDVRSEKVPANRDAIVRALRSGQLAGYAGDVWFPQPAPPDHPWRTMPFEAMTPHISGSSLSAQARYAVGVREIQ